MQIRNENNIIEKRHEKETVYVYQWSMEGRDKTKDLVQSKHRSYYNTAAYAQNTHHTHTHDQRKRAS